jgi:hypothetical protein
MEASAVQCQQAETPIIRNTGQAAAELDALLPAIIDRAFKGEL